MLTRWRLLKTTGDRRGLVSVLILGDMLMKINQRSSERVIRVIAGVVLALISLFSDIIPTTFSWIIGISGAILIVTGLVAYCPAWHLLGISTAKKPANS